MTFFMSKIMSETMPNYQLWTKLLPRTIEKLNMLNIFVLWFCVDIHANTWPILHLIYRCITANHYGKYYKQSNMILTRLHTAQLEYALGKVKYFYFWLFQLRFDCFMPWLTDLNGNRENYQILSSLTKNCCKKSQLNVMIFKFASFE